MRKYGQCQGSRSAAKPDGSLPVCYTFAQRSSGVMKPHNDLFLEVTGVLEARKFCTQERKKMVRGYRNGPLDVSSSIGNKNGFGFSQEVIGSQDC